MDRYKNRKDFITPFVVWYIRELVINLKQFP